MCILKSMKQDVWKLPRRHHFGDQHILFFSISLTVSISFFFVKRLAYVQVMLSRIIKHSHIPYERSVRTETGGITDSYVPSQACCRTSAHEMGQCATLLLVLNLSYFSCLSLSPKSTYGNRSHINEMCIQHDATMLTVKTLNDTDIENIRSHVVGSEKAFELRTMEWVRLYLVWWGWGIDKSRQRNSMRKMERSLPHEKNKENRHVESEGRETWAE